VRVISKSNHIPGVFTIDFRTGPVGSTSSVYMHSPYESYIKQSSYFFQKLIPLSSTSCISDPTQVLHSSTVGLCTVTVFTVYTAVFNTAVTVAVVHREGLTVTKHRQNTVRLT
jgi:hypothetical protein